MSLEKCDNWHSLQTPVDCFVMLRGKIKDIGSKILCNDVDVDYCWTVKMKPGERGLLHNHPTFPLVAVYYASVTENSGNLIFDTLNYQVVPENDMLVVFDGTLLHSIDYNKSNYDRISIGTHLKISETINV